MCVHVVRFPTPLLTRTPTHNTHHPPAAHTLEALLPDIESQWERQDRCQLFWPTLAYIKTSRRAPFKYREYVRGGRVHACTHASVRCAHQLPLPPRPPPPHPSDIDEEINLDTSRKNVGGSLFFLPEDCMDLQETWQQWRQFQLHPRVDPAAHQQHGDDSRRHPPPYLRAEAGAYGVASWTNVPPHLKTFSRALPTASEAERAAHGEPLAWLWLTSCNLSGGALGVSLDDAKVTMRNFEAGVLFHSSASPGTGGLVYRAWPTAATATDTDGGASSSSTPRPLPPGWPPGARTVYLPLPYRLDAPPYTEQDEEKDPTPDLLLPPYFHSHQELLRLARLARLRPQIEAVYMQVAADLEELARVHRLDSRGRPLRGGRPLSAPLPSHPLAAVDGNVDQGRGREGEERVQEQPEGKRLKAAAFAAAGEGKKRVV